MDMTNLDLHASGRTSRWTHLLREWWPVPAIICSSLLAQWLLITSRYDVAGHATGHLASATAPFLAAPLVFLLFWATPAARRQMDLLIVSGVWFATTVAVMVGNLRVVDDLIDAGYSRTPTGSLPDVADHSLANSSVWYAAVAALVVIAAWHRRGHIGNRATVGAIAVSLIVPPWIIPGAGMIVLTIVRLLRRHREISQATVSAAR